MPSWHSSLPLMLSDQIEHIQKRALKIVFPHLSYTEALDKAKLKTLQERRENQCRSLYQSILRGDNKLTNLLPSPITHKFSLRNPRKYPLFKCRTNDLKTALSRTVLQSGILLIISKRLCLEYSNV